MTSSATTRIGVLDLATLSAREDGGSARNVTKAAIATIQRFCHEACILAS